MTSPGRYRNEPADIVEEIGRVKKRLDALEQNPRAGNTTIDTGAFQVKDASGVVRARMGLLSDGTYGFEVLEDGAAVFHQVPYIYTNFVNTSTGESTTSTTYTDLATVGPRVSVPIRSTGRILIIATAQIQSVTPVSNQPNIVFDGRFDVAFTGANTRNPDEVNDPLVGIMRQAVLVSAGNILIAPRYSITAQGVFEGLNSGSTTITMKYRTETDKTDTPNFFRRTLTVFSI